MSIVRPASGPAPLLVLLPVVAVLGIGYVAATDPTTTLVLLGLALLAVAFTLPLWSLPSICVWIFALLPVGYLLGVPIFVARFFTPAVVVLAVWLLRLGLRQGRHEIARSLRWLVPVVVVLLALSYLGLSPKRSVIWVAVVVITVALPAAVLPVVDARTSDALLRSWFGVGILLSVLAVIESLVEANPLDPYYVFGQHWSVYRVSTTLGHPLMNGTFFAVTACLAAFTMTRVQAPRALAGICFVLTALAAALTGSRSGVYALVCGLGVGLLVTLVSGRTSIANKLLGIVLGVVALVVLPALPTIAGRAGSAEATASSLYRDAVVKLAGRLFRASPWVGYGPGNSPTATVRAGYALPLENSVLGTVVSVGVIGVAALLVLVVVVLVRVGRGSRADGIAAVAAFVVAGSAFPLWESNPAGLVLVGLAALASVSSKVAAAEALDPVVVDPVVVAPVRDRRVPVRGRAVPVGALPRAR